MSEAAKKPRKPQIPEDWPQPLPASQDAMDLFIDALLLEDGLSRNTLEAYRRDLTAASRWLAKLEPARRWTPRRNLICKSISARGWTTPKPPHPTGA